MGDYGISEEERDKITCSRCKQSCDDTTIKKCPALNKQIFEV